MESTFSSAASRSSCLCGGIYSVAYGNRYTGFCRVFIALSLNAVKHYGGYVYAVLFNALIDYLAETLLIDKEFNLKIECVFGIASVR